MQNVMLAAVMVLNYGLENVTLLCRLMAVTTAWSWGKLKDGIPVE